MLLHFSALMHGCSIICQLPDGLIKTKFKKIVKKLIRTDFWNVNISNGFFFFERCSLITATVCANKFSNGAIQFVYTHRRSYMSKNLPQNEHVSNVDFRPLPSLVRLKIIKKRNSMRTIQCLLYSNSSFYLIL